MAKTNLTSEKADIIANCIISNLSRFSLKEALNEYGLKVSDLIDYMNIVDNIVGQQAVSR